MADDNVPTEPVPNNKNEQSFIPGDTPAQEGPSMGVSLIGFMIYFMIRLIQSCRSIVSRIGQLVSLIYFQSLIIALKGCQASETPTGVGLAMKLAQEILYLSRNQETSQISGVDVKYVAGFCNFSTY